MGDKCDISIKIVWYLASAFVKDRERVFTQGQI